MATAASDGSMRSLAPEFAIAAISLFARGIALALSVFTAEYLPAFDTSHLVAVRGSPAGTLAGLRWDAVHFASVALNGYRHEQQLAFMPGWLYAMRYAGMVVQWLRGGAGDLSVQDVVWGGQAVAIICSIGSAVMLYRLTARLTSNPSFAFMAAIFQTVLPPSPSTHIAPYTETPFALLTFTGFYLVAGRRYLAASVCFGLSSAVRANGILAIGVVGWEMLRTGAALAAIRERRLWRLTKLALRIFPCVLAVLLPFVLFQLYTYRMFCLDGDTSRPWCNATIPVSYSFVQGHYWNVGLFKYWTAAQIPNLLLAGPVFLVSLATSLRFFLGASPDPKLAPYHLHHLGMTFLLMFASHSQIALRVCASDPVVWWGITESAFDWRTKQNPRGLTTCGRVWVAWSLVWGLVSIVLWAGFYPPA